MKSLTIIALTASALLLSANTAFAKPLSQNQALGQCKTLAKTQFSNIRSIKVANMKTSRGKFKVKLRVTAEQEKGMFLCTIDRDQDAQIVRLDKNAKAVAVQ